MEKVHTHALVVLSGGQDSTTCLGIAMAKAEVVSAISFVYGQKHEVEIGAAKYLCDKYGITQTIIDLSPILQNMQSSALITGGDTTKPHAYLKDLPASFVPARNALFLTAAYGLAMERGCDAIYTGVCQTDYSGYPDCRYAFIVALNEALDLGYQSRIRIETPLMFTTKADTFKLAERYGVLQDVIDVSVTCYDGDVSQKHEWGMGCGTCPACMLRQKGWLEYRAKS